MVEVVTRQRTAIAIGAEPVKKIMAVVQPMIINSNTWELLNEDEKFFYDTLRLADTLPYPSKRPCPPCTIFPIRETTEIKVVPDIQPRIPKDFTKGKKKLFPEDDLSADQIAEEVQKIDEACASAETPDQASSSYTDKNEDCPVGGSIRTGSFIEFLVQTVLRISPLPNTLSTQALVSSLQGRQLLRLPVPFDLDLPESTTFIHPPTFQINEDYFPSSDAYTTSIPFAPPAADDQASSTIDPQDESRRLRGEVNALKESVADLKLMMAELLKRLNK